MCDLHNRFINFAFAKCRKVQSLPNHLQVPLIETLLQEFNELQPNSTTNMIFKRADIYSVSSLREIWQAAKIQSTVHDLTVREGQACKTWHSEDADDKLKRFITFSMKHILSHHHGSKLPMVQEISKEWDRTKPSVDARAITHFTHRLSLAKILIVAVEHVRRVRADQESQQDDRLLAFRLEKGAQGAPYTQERQHTRKPFG